MMMLMFLMFFFHSVSPSSTDYLMAEGVNKMDIIECERFSDSCVQTESLFLRKCDHRIVLSIN